jgi:hypothetical protein
MTALEQTTTVLNHINDVSLHPKPFRHDRLPDLSNSFVDLATLYHGPAKSVPNLRISWGWS